jgi:catechol 2,3-dioxygenase-like lactoylglutathione lyase family enzyme
MITQIRHTGLVVANLEDALHFWRDLLGFKVEKQMAPEGGMIELLHFKSHPDQTKWLGNPYSTGFTHIAMTVNNLDEAYKKLEAVGVVFPAQPQYSTDGTVKVIYCKGPEGVLLELVERLNV